MEITLKEVNDKLDYLTKIIEEHILKSCNKKKHDTKPYFDILDTLIKNGTPEMRQYFNHLKTLMQEVENHE